MNEQVRMPVLPVEAYTSQAWFDREQEHIFSRTWQYAGLAEDVSEPGQFISVQAGLNNIFIVMGRDRRLRAFHNICRHRGTQLLRAVGKTQKAITCPYHDWTYDLEGNLISVPDREREFPDLDLSCKGSAQGVRRSVARHPLGPSRSGCRFHRRVVRRFREPSCPLHPG